MPKYGLLSFVGKVAEDILPFLKCMTYVGQKVIFSYNNINYYGIVYSWEYILYEHGLVSAFDISSIEKVSDVDKDDSMIFNKLTYILNQHHFLEFKRKRLCHLTFLIYFV